MKRKSLTMNKTKRLLFMAMVAAACAMPCIVLADGAARENAATWTPGTPNPDWPHVVAGNKEGLWMPDAGYMFANDTPGDFSVIPVVAPKDIIVRGGPMPTIKVPPPDGFLPVEADQRIAHMCLQLDAAFEQNLTLQHWFMRDEQDRSEWWEAKIFVAKNLQSVHVPYTDFLDVSRQIVENRVPDDIWKRAGHSAEVGNRSLTKDGMAVFDSPTVKGLTVSGAHYSDERSVHWTLVRTDERTEKGERIESFYVSSSAMIWADGRLFTMTMGIAAKNEDSLESGISESRSRLRRWTEAMYASNGITGDLLDFERPVQKTTSHLPPIQDNSSYTKERSIRPASQRWTTFLGIGVFLAILVALLVFRMHGDSGTNGEMSEKHSDAEVSGASAGTGDPNDRTAWANFGGAPIAVKLAVVCCGLAVLTWAWQGLQALDGPSWIIASVCIAFLVWMAHCILAGRKWPKFYLSVGGAIALLLGIVERATVPADIWTSTSRALVIGGILQFVLGGLLSGGKAMAWAEEKRKQKRKE